MLGVVSLEVMAEGIRRVRRAESWEKRILDFVGCDSEVEDSKCSANKRNDE